MLRRTPKFGEYPHLVPASERHGSDCVLKASIQQSATTVNASTNLTVADSSKLKVGMTLGHSHIPANTISSITDSTTVVMSATATASSATTTFASTNGIPTVCGMVPFTDKNDMRRLGDYWTIGSEGRIFFLREYPYHVQTLWLLRILQAAVGFLRLFKRRLSWSVLKFTSR